MTDSTMPERLWADYGGIFKDSRVWYEEQCFDWTTEYIRADVAGKTVVIKSDMAHELKAAIEFYEGVIKELKAQIVSLQMQQEDGR
jgi:hypothetical protein